MKKELLICSSFNFRLGAIIFMPLSHYARIATKFRHALKNFFAREHLARQGFAVNADVIPFFIKSSRMRHP
mgnify:CR=1 FL=1